MNEELQELLRTPRESLDVELKQWMDPNDKGVQAKLAKELLALRNHGGGYLIIGFRDGHPPEPDPARPPDLAGFSTDVFNNIVKRYAEPGFHCTSHIVAHPDTGEPYPIIQVPGGATVPVRCRADPPDGSKSVKVDSYYIRRPGPESNTPQTAAEWDAFLERCLLNRRDDLMAKVAGLLGAGRLAPVSVAPAHPFDELRVFRDEAVARLEKLQKENLPDGDPARFVHGRFILSARIVGDLAALTPPELLEHLARLRGYTGWSPLYVFTRPELEPYLVADDLVECWLARDEARDVTHADFWRASTKGLVTLVRGHQEDSPELSEKNMGPPPGKGMELTLPTWRIAEFLLRVRELGLRIATGPFTIQLIVQWEGLDGRKLFSHGQRRPIFENYVARSPAYTAEFEVAPDEVDAALPAVLERIVAPLLRRFSLFEPPKALYEQELQRLLKREYT
jgi:hypothetical protein